MPDGYYTHKFSGEEIDDAVDAAQQLLENAVMQNATLLTSSDNINTGNLKTGYYWWRTNSMPEGDPGDTLMNGKNFRFMLVNKVSSSTSHQFVYPWGIPSLMAQRAVSNDKPSAWEQQNPPMQNNIEYRTTKRCRGKPVYAKRVVYTPSTAVSNANLDITHGITGFSSLLRVEGSDSPYPIPRLESGGGFVGVTYVNETIIRVAVYNTTIAAGRTLAITVYYTKTTN